MAFLKKVKKAAKAVVQGTRDYSQEMKAIDLAAEKTVGKSGDRELDVQKQYKLRKKMKEEQGKSWMGAVKKRYNSY